MHIVVLSILASSSRMVELQSQMPACGLFRWAYVKTGKLWNPKMSQYILKQHTKKECAMYVDFCDIAHTILAFILHIPYSIPMSEVWANDALLYVGYLFTSFEVINTHHTAQPQWFRWTFRHFSANSQKRRYRYLSLAHYLSVCIENRLTIVGRRSFVSLFISKLKKKSLSINKKYLSMFWHYSSNKNHIEERNTTNQNIA